MKDFFISYNSADKSYATWIAATLENAGYTVLIQDWDFLPGQNFVQGMHQATIDCKRTIAVLSNQYLSALFTMPEWQAAFVQDPTGEKRLLIPIRVRPCEPVGLLKAIIYCDLVNTDEIEAKKRLLQAVSDQRKKPLEKPTWPASNMPNDRARKLLNILETSFTTFKAQVALRNQLYFKITERLGHHEQLKFEEFFEKYFDKMSSDELRLHQIIRNFTKDVLSEYNRKALEILEEENEVLATIPKMNALKHHLLIWLAKYEAVFLSRPSTCLIYVGVEEKVPFPRGIEDEIRKVLTD